MDLRRPPSVPRWVVVPGRAARAFGGTYAVWALVKTVASVVPRMQCGGPPPGVVKLAVAGGLVEVAIGLVLAAGSPRAQRVAALAGTGLNAGFIGFAFVAKSRGLPVSGCGCFGGIDLPWEAHAAIAAGLACIFLAILLDLERRLAAGDGSR